MAQRTLTEKNQLVETLFLDRPHPPFRKSVEVGRPCWELERLDAYSEEDVIEGLGEFGITVMEQVAGVGHGTVLYYQKTQPRSDGGLRAQGLLKDSPLCDDATPIAAHRGRRLDEPTPAGCHRIPPGRESHSD